ncbi:MAG: hypothetical protein H7333_09655 [Bdellovibrionales bacterium]|nr:hypothetical protein [Oligoflexia bacterium]
MHKSKSVSLLGLAFALQINAAHGQSISVAAPDSDRIEANEQDTLTRSVLEGLYDVRSNRDSQKVVGFSFRNGGPNRIIPFEEPEEGAGPKREFHFEFKDRARQDIQLRVTDFPTEFGSQRMETYLYFFPRLNLPAIEASEPGHETLKVTLPTGEAVFFDGKSKVMTGGALVETFPIDMGPDRFKRKFCGIQYKGTGLMLRVDRRGNDPRIDTVATIQNGAKPCIIPASLLFNQSEKAHLEFLYPTDDAFREFLQKQCKMTF